MEVGLSLFTFKNLNDNINNKNKSNNGILQNKLFETTESESNITTTTNNNIISQHSFPPQQELTFLQQEPQQNQSQQPTAQQQSAQHPPTQPLSTQPPQQPSTQPPPSKKSPQQQNCCGCNELIEEKYLLKIGEDYWHECCVKCCICETALDNSCYVKNKRLLCRVDYER